MLTNTGGWVKTRPILVAIPEYPDYSVDTRQYRCLQMLTSGSKPSSLPDAHLNIKFGILTYYSSLIFLMLHVA